MNPGDVVDLTLRNLRVVEVRPMSTLLMGTLPNGEPFEIRVPFDADAAVVTVGRTTQCASTLIDDADHTHRCALYVDDGPHTDCLHICVTCDKQWGGA